MMRRRYVDGPWGQIHLRVAGNGQARPPLLLLHPTPKSGWIFEPLVEALASARMLIAPDTPGYGASDAPPAPVGIVAYAEVLAGVIMTLVAEGIIPDGPVDVLGYHTGSAIAVALARLFPIRVRRLVLVSLPAFAPHTRQEKLSQLARWPAATLDGAQLRSMWTTMSGLFDRRVSAEWRHLSYAENLRSGQRAWWGYDAVYRYDLQAALDAIEQTTLVLNPEDDLCGATRANASRIRNGRVVELPGLAHGLFVLEPDLIASVVDRFLTDDIPLSDDG